MFVIGPGLLAPSMGRNEPPRAMAIAGGLGAVLIGAAMILYGTDKWGKWLYVAPLIAVIGFLLTWTNVGGLVSFALLLLPFLLAIGAHEYYRKRSARAG